MMSRHFGNIMNMLLRNILDLLTDVCMVSAFGTLHQPAMVVANPARGQLKTKKILSPFAPEN